MQKYAIIVAGGTGSRMGDTLPKQFLEIRRKPMLLHSVETFIAFGAQVVLVVHPAFIDLAKEILEKHSIVDVNIIPGGATRYASVQNGIHSLQHQPGDCIVMVHDAARPFIDVPFLQNICDLVSENICVIPILDVVDSLRLVTNVGSKIINRDEIKIVQTPQVANLKNFQTAFSQDFNNNFTDEASVCESIGMQIKLVPGLDKNVKITTPQQLIWANSI